MHLLLVIINHYTCAWQDCFLALWCIIIHYCAAKRWVIAMHKHIVWLGHAMPPPHVYETVYIRLLYSDYFPETLEPPPRVKHYPRTLQQELAGGKSLKLLQRPWRLLHSTTHHALTEKPRKFEQTVIPLYYNDQPTCMRRSLLSAWSMLAWVGEQAPFNSDIASIHKGWNPY